MTKYTFKKVRPIYTGGGIYVIDGMTEGDTYFMACPSDGYTEMLTDDGSQTDADGNEVMYNSEWLCNHRYETLTDGIDNDDFMVCLCQWIIKNRPDGNYSLYDIEKMLIDYTESSARVNKEPIEGNLEEIDVGGPVDALMDWWMDKAETDKYYGRDSDETPCNATSICVSLGEIARRATDGCHRKVEFFVNIRNDNGIIEWEVSDKAVEYADTIEVYKVVVDEDPYLYRVLYESRYIEEHYCSSSDITYLVEIVKVGDEVKSMEVISFYSGEPNPRDTEHYTKARSLKAEYTL